MSFLQSVTRRRGIPTTVVWTTFVLAGMSFVSFGILLAINHLLVPSRGLDLTDEGLYLLAADPPTPSASWGLPFGWTLRPIFEFADFDIATFRTISSFALVFMFGLLGAAAGAVACTPPRLAPRDSGMAISLCSLTGVFGSLIFFAPMLRTPSYNWTNLMGLLVAGTCALALPLIHGHARSDLRRVLSFVLLGISSVALFLTIPSKPTTLIFGVVLTAVIVVARVGIKAGAFWVIGTIILQPVWLLFALMTGLWPRNFLAVFDLALRMPSFDPLQTPLGAVQAALLLPRDLVASVALAPARALALYGIAVMLVIVPLVTRKRLLGWRLLGVGLSIPAACAIAGVPVPLLRGEWQAFGIASSSLTTACLSLLAVILLASLKLGWMSSSTPKGHWRYSRWPIVTVLALFPFAFSFGSGNGIYAQASLASGLLILAGAISLCTRNTRGEETAVLVMVALAALTMGLASVLSGWNFPFRMKPLSEQTTSTVVGIHDSRLDLDPGLSNTISELRRWATAHGWVEGTPILDVSIMWHPSVGYALGGRAPDSLVLTIFGYGAAHDVVAYHLSEPFRKFPFAEAWILTSVPSSLSDPTGQSAVEFTMERISEVSGRPFPESYACFSAGDFILWQPVDSLLEAKGNCERPGAKSSSAATG